MIIDVSSNNPEILPNFATGVIIKATQGVDYINPYLQSFVSQCESKDIPFGLYFYLDKSVAIQDQVSYFEKIISSFASNASFYMVDAEANLALVDGIIINGKRPYIYCSLDNFNRLSGLNYEFIIANWMSSAQTSLEIANKQCGSKCVGVQWTDNYSGYDAYLFNTDIFTTNPLPINTSGSSNLTFIEQLNQLLDTHIANGTVAQGENKFVATIENESGGIGLTNVGGIYTVGSQPFYGSMVGIYPNIQLLQATLDYIPDGYKVTLPSGSQVIFTPNGISLLPSIIEIAWSTGSNGEGWFELPYMCYVLSVIPQSRTNPKDGLEVTFYPNVVITKQQNLPPIISWNGAKPDTQTRFTLELV